jgi:diketogulonate reductase-like aldo/keto reductase
MTIIEIEQQDLVKWARRYDIDVVAYTELITMLYKCSIEEARMKLLL